jgi:hypothetical protein
VISERDRVLEMACTDSVRTNNLGKIYANGYVAVKGTSFGIDKG